MTYKRKKRATIRTAAQLRALASPVSIEVIQMLRTGGAATVAELGPRLGRKANSLHYHIRKLARAGFIRKIGARRSGARTEASYDVTAEIFRYENAPENPRLRKHVNDIVAAMLRLAMRNFARASQRPQEVREGGAHANILADRYKGRLTRPQLAEVNHHLRAAREILISSCRSRRGELCTLTVVLTPEADQCR